MPSRGIAFSGFFLTTNVLNGLWLNIHCYLINNNLKKTASFQDFIVFLQLRQYRKNFFNCLSIKAIQNPCIWMKKCKSFLANFPQ